jgi:hypothetical protein
MVDCYLSDEVDSLISGFDIGNLDEFDGLSFALTLPSLSPFTTLSSFATLSPIATFSAFSPFTAFSPVTAFSPFAALSSLPPFAAFPPILSVPPVTALSAVAAFPSFPPFSALSAVAALPAFASFAAFAPVPPELVVVVVPPGSPSFPVPGAALSALDLLGRDVEVGVGLDVVLLLRDAAEHVDLEHDVALHDLAATIADGDDLALRNDLVVLQLEQSIGHASLVAHHGLDQGQLLAVLQGDHVHLLLGFHDADLNVVAA